MIISIYLLKDFLVQLKEILSEKENDLSDDFLSGYEQAIADIATKLDSLKDELQKEPHGK